MIVKSMYNQTLGQETVLVDVKGKGIVKDIYISFSHSNVRLSVKVDDVEVLPVHRSFDDLINHSPYTTLFSAFQDNVYVFTMSKIRFKKAFALVINPFKPVTVSMYVVVVK